jgi:hypothetical protein
MTEGSIIVQTSIREPIYGKTPHWTPAFAEVTILAHVLLSVIPVKTGIQELTIDGKVHPIMS